MDLKERIEAFTGLGKDLREGLSDPGNSLSPKLNYLIENQHLHNEWFTPENVRMALSEIAGILTTELLIEWTGKYPALKKYRNPAEIGVIMAGNIPLVGFHDFLCVLISGNNLKGKISSKDSELIVFLSEIMCQNNPGFRNKISLTEENLSGFEGIIATGSDNTSRYFEYYFGKYPNIIRRNRNSVAIIDGSESETELRSLGRDIFSYFGLGCRNVSKLLVPDGYDFSLMLKSWEDYSSLRTHKKYANNYDFSKAVYIVNREKFTDTGYLLLKEKSELSSPVAVVYFEYYTSVEKLYEIIDNQSNKIQCIIGKKHIPFGKAQSPALWDYSDGVDTLEFLLKNF